MIWLLDGSCLESKSNSFLNFHDLLGALMNMPLTCSLQGAMNINVEQDHGRQAFSFRYQSQCKPLWKTLATKNKNVCSLSLDHAVTWCLPPDAAALLSLKWTVLPPSLLVSTICTDSQNLKSTQTPVLALIICINDLHDPVTGLLSECAISTFN